MSSPNPRLSWNVLAGQKNGARQTAYRIKVSSVSNGRGDLWDSGKIASDKTFDIRYEGKSLKPFQTAYWQIYVWDEEDRVSGISGQEFWTQAPDEWPAKWIGYDAPLQRAKPIDLEGAHWIWHEDDEPMKSPPGVCFFKTEFNLTNDAVLEILASADDRFVLRIDGDEVSRSDDELHSWSRPVRCEVHLKKGAHTIEAEVENCNYGAGAFIAKVRTKNSETVTDESWQARKSGEEEWSNCQRVAQYGGAPWGKLREVELFLPPPRYLRKEFTVSKPVKEAMLYSTALGLCSFGANGASLTKEFVPGWTDFTKRVHYHVTPVQWPIRQGTNALSVVLADGWFAGYVGFKPERHQYGSQTRFSGFLRLLYEDGSDEIIPSDESWKANTGGLLYADLLMGESFDARLEPQGWRALDFDDSEWHQVSTDTELEPVIEPDPIGGYWPQSMYPQSVTRIDEETYIYDFGQNFAGTVRVNEDRLSPGQEVVFRHAEMLDEHGALYTDNLRTAQATDRYIVGDDRQFNFVPQFTYHGFRYVEVTGIDHEIDLMAVAFCYGSLWPEHMPMLVTSDERLNKLWLNIEWTQLSNFIEVPTDCPQRDERLGWTGDIQIYARTAAIIADVQAFLRKWLVDLSDAQREDGQYPMVAPLKVAGDDGGPAWSEAGVIVPWALYQVYEDKEVLERQWDSMVRFIDFCESRSPDGRAPEDYHCFGDWLNVDAETPHDVIYTAYFSHAANLMSKIAAILNIDASRYAQLFATSKESFVEQFVSDDGTVKGDTQTGYVMALAFDLVDGELKEKVVNKLVENIERHGHLTTGFVGTKDLMLVLRDIGRTDIAYKLLLSDEYPGWLFSVKHGATTIWERWNGWTPEDGFADPAMNSFSHYAYGAVGQFMFETIAGIRPLGPGYKKILIAPEPGPLTSCKTAYDSVRGRIEVDWRIEDGVFRMDIEIPPNTTATVKLPSGEERDVESGRWSF